MSRCRAERTDISEATVSSRPLCSNSPMRSATSHEHSTVCFHWGNIPYARSSDRISFVGMSALYISFSRTFLVLPRRHLINFSPALRLSNEILVQVIAIRSNGRHMVSCLNSNFICIFMRSNVLKIIVSLSFYCVPGSERNCSNSIKSLEERGLIKNKIKSKIDSFFLQRQRLCNHFSSGILSIFFVFAENFKFHRDVALLANSDDGWHHFLLRYLEQYPTHWIELQSFISRIMLLIF